MANQSAAPAPAVPPVSVVLAASGDGWDLARCCAAVLPQVHEVGAELIVVAHEDQVPPLQIAAAAARTRWVSAPHDARLPDLFGLGLARASGDVVALTDTYCVPEPGWLRAVLRAHRGAGRRVVGGVVEPAPDLDWVSYAAFLLEYGQFTAPLGAGPAREIAGDNLSFPRAALADAAGPERRGFWKTFAVWDMAQKGYEVVSDPAIAVVQYKSFALRPFLVRRFHHGRCFAGMRAAGLSSTRRAAYVLLAPLLPFLFLTRLLRRLLPKRRHLVPLARSLPVILLGILWWSAGEAWGYLTGPGTSGRHVV